MVTFKSIENICVNMHAAIFLIKQISFVLTGKEISWEVGSPLPKA